MIFLYLLLACSFTSLKDRLQEIVDRNALYWNVSFSVGVAYEGIGTIGVAGGPNDRQKAESKTTVDDLFPGGSCSKFFTSAGALRLQERGILNLDQPVVEVLEPWLLKNYNYSMIKNFPPAFANVTTRMLLGMTSGLQDYDDETLEHWTYTHPDEDWTPLDMIQTVNKTLLFSPGSTPGFYSTTGYNIVGLMMTALTNQSKWEDLDYESIVFPDPSKYPNIRMQGRGSCSDFDGIVNQYAPRFNKLNEFFTVVDFKDITPYSCLNSWTGGGMVYKPSELAAFHHEFWTTDNVVSKQSKREMSAFHKVVIFPPFAVPDYGLGMFPSDYITMIPKLHSPFMLWGHGGEDWGSIVYSGYNPVAKYGFAFATNSLMGMNCSWVDLLHNNLAVTKTLCELQVEVVKELGY